MSACWRALCEQGSGAVQLTDRVRFCAGRRDVLAGEPAGSGAAAAMSRPFAALPEKRAEFALPGGGTLTAGLFTADFEEKIQGVHKKDLKNQADYARITTLYAGLVLRTRQPGDVTARRGEVYTTGCANG